MPSDRKRGRGGHIPEASGGEAKHVRTKCRPKMFNHLVSQLPTEKKECLTDMGFGGVLAISCKTIKTDLCDWLIKQYNVETHELQFLNTHVSLKITEELVNEILGLPCGGTNIDVALHQTSHSRKYKELNLEDLILSTPIGDDFKRYFLIFLCATIVAPGSTDEGVHGLWDYIFAIKPGTPLNWSRFLLRFLEDGIQDHKENGTTFMRGSLLFLQLVYFSQFEIPSFTNPTDMPRCIGWTEEKMKQRLKAEVKRSRAYGCVTLVNAQAQAQAQPNNQNQQNTPSERAKIEELEAELKAHKLLIEEQGRKLYEQELRQHELEQKVVSLASILEENKGRGTPCTPAFHQDHPATSSPVDKKSLKSKLKLSSSFCPSERPTSSKLHSPSPPRPSTKGIESPNVEAQGPPPPEVPRRGTRAIQIPRKFQSPFVIGCFKQPRKRLTDDDQALAHYALTLRRRDGEVLSDMHEYHLTRKDLLSLADDNWVNSAVMTMHSRVLNYRPDTRGLHYYLDPAFSDLLLKLGKAQGPINWTTEMKNVLSPRRIDLTNCSMLFLPICIKNHWVVLVVNIMSRRIEILSSQSIGRGGKIPNLYKQVTATLEAALHAEGLLTHLNITDFNFVAPDVPVQKNSHDCGIFAMEFMSQWKGGRGNIQFTQDMALHMRLRYVLDFILDENNVIKQHVMSRIYTFDISQS